MKPLLSVQDQFSLIYNSLEGDNGPEKYHKAVNIWEERFEMKSPYKNYDSFRRVSIYYNYEKGKS